ncbi:MAG: hypothetical protein HY721_23085 [Planctomycetes bacterium]|nr:hypothetical protein [Planctomycetota bacterium]
MGSSTSRSISRSGARRPITRSPTGSATKSRLPPAASAIPSPTESRPSKRTVFETVRRSRSML